MRADARPPALLALASLALVLADARAPALLALVPPALVRADAHPRRLPFSSFGCRHGRHRRQDTLQIRVQHDLAVLVFVPTRCQHDGAWAQRCRRGSVRGRRHPQPPAGKLH